MTLNGIMHPICVISPNSVAPGAHCVKLVEDVVKTLTFAISSLDEFLVTGSIARSGSRRFLIYSEANFDVFRPAGATRCTDGVKFGMEEGTFGPSVPSSVPNFTPVGATTRVLDPKN